MNSIHKTVGALMSVVCLAATGASSFDGYGEWRGQAQYVVTRHDESSPAMQDVTPLTIRIDPDGKVVGTSTGNGCRFLGVASPMGNNVMKLDMTLRKCSYKALNRRVSGTVAHYRKDGRLEFSLQKMDTSSRPITIYGVTSSMRR